MANTPNIRFKGFTDVWERRKVGDLVIDHNAGVYISKEDYGSGTNVIGVGNIYDRDIFDGEIYKLGPVNDSKYLLEENDLIYGESSLVPEGIARTICVGKYGVGSAFAWHTRRVKLNSNLVNSHFATLELNYHPKVRKHLMSVSTQTALTGMTTEGYFSAKLLLPTVAEQNRISKLFQQIDSFITLHQRKCDEVKQLKKFMLQKMFPKSGELIPEIRFAGFSDAWEQRKLIDVCDYVDYRGKTPTKTEMGIFLVTAKNIKNGYIDYEVSKEYISEDDYEEVMRRGKPEIGDVLITTEAPCGNVAQVNYENIALAQRIIKYCGHSNMIDNAYLKYYLLSPEFQKVLDAKSSGGTVRGIKGSVLHQQTIQYPLYEEQVKIGLYLNSLDHLITLHQRKCDELKEVKRFMLQNMFPQKG